MLVCSVSMFPRRQPIEAELAEVGLAEELLASAASILAGLVDDPAAATEYADAYTGDIMVEAANADAIADVGLAYNISVNEPATADAIVSVAAPPGYVARSAMIPGPMFINPSASRQASVTRIMVNL